MMDDLTSSMLEGTENIKHVAGTISNLVNTQQQKIWLWKAEISRK